MSQHAQHSNALYSEVNSFQRNVDKHVKYKMVY